MDHHQPAMLYHSFDVLFTLAIFEHLPEIAVSEARR